MNSSTRRLFIRDGYPSLFSWFLVALVCIVAIAGSANLKDINEHSEALACEAKGGVYIHTGRIDGKTPAHTLCIKKSAVIE